MILGITLAGAALLPAEHVHESDEAHPSATIHRHSVWQNQPGNHGDAQFDHHVPSRVVWLTPAWLHQAPVQVPPPILAAAAIVAVAPEASPGVRVRFNDAAPPHGPPRATRRLRAPPLSRLI